MTKPPKKSNSRVSGGLPPQFAPVRLSFDLYNARFVVRERPQVVPGAGIFDAPFACVRINFDWLVHLYGALDALTQRDGWQGDESEIDRAVQEIEALMNAMQKTTGCVELGENTLLRQNPGNSCQLQQSQDGGVTWTLAFDYSKCRPRPNQIELNIQNETTLNTYVNTVNEYNNDNSITVFAPQLVITGIAETDDYINLAMCKATHDLVGWACEIELEKRAQDALIGGLIASVLGIVGTLVGAGIILTTAGAGTAVGFAVGSAIVGVGASTWSGVSSQVLGNELARSNVACCLYNAIKGQTPERNIFINALNGCSFPFGSDEAQIAGAIASILGGDGVHATWAKYASENLQYAKLGLINCPCSESWVYDVDFRVGWGLWSTIGDGYSDCRREDGVGLVYDSGYSAERNIAIKTPEFLQSSTIITVDIEYIATRGDDEFNNNSDDLVIGAGVRKPDNTYQQDYIPYANTTEYTTRQVIFGIDATQIFVTLRHAVDFQGDNPGSGVIRRVIVSGTGFNPFS